MNFLNYLEKHKTLIILSTILGVICFSLFSISFGMEEIENLDFNVGQVTANKLNIRRGPRYKF